MFDDIEVRQTHACPSGGETLRDRLARWSREDPGGIAYQLVEGSTQHRVVWTWRGLEEAIEQQVTEFRRQVSLGSRVALLDWPEMELPVGILAGLCAGVSVLPLASGVSLDRAQRLADEIGAFLVDRAGSIRVPRNVTIDGTPGNLLLRTSGTSGDPGVVVRPSWTVDQVACGTAMQLNMQRGDRVVSMLPMSHSYGVEHAIFGPIWGGATVVLTGGMDLGRIIDALNTAPTHFPGVPAVYEQLCARVRLTRFSIRVAYSAGAPLPHTLFREVGDRLGVTVAQLYGSTEVGSVTFSPSDSPEFDAMAVGRPFPRVRITIVDPDTGEPCRHGDEGEVVVNAPSMLTRYADRDVDWHAFGFPTADLGRMDERGCLTITGRAKLLIDVGAAKVNPMEVEATILNHPAISACVVGGIRQTLCVERVKAWVELRADHAGPFDADELRGFLRSQLDGYKVPRMVEVVDRLPRSATGKILRGSLLR